jgi:hypothetical protein
MMKFKRLELDLPTNGGTEHGLPSVVITVVNIL